MESKDRATYYLVDAKGEGGLVYELDRVAMRDAPTLLIGLGGTGIDALVHAKYTLGRKLHREGKPLFPGRIAFLGIDTDTASEKIRVGDVKLGSDELINIYDLNLFHYMKNHSAIKYKYHEEWLAEGIPVWVARDGASGIRQFGRFLLMNKIIDLEKIIRRKLEQIWDAKNSAGVEFNTTRDAYNIIVFAGISGGTGSGTFLDMPYIIKAINRSTARAIKCWGFLFMPDVNLSTVKDPNVRQYIPINGYASMKELDFWMNPDRGVRFRQQYSETLTVDSDDPPYECAFLIGPNDGGASAYTECMRTTAECVLNILSAVEDTGDPNSKVDFHAFINNLVSMLPSISRPYLGNYLYFSMGMDERRLQRDKMANYLAYYLLTCVEKLFKNEPAKQEVENFYGTTTVNVEKNSLQLGEKGMHTLFNRQLRTTALGDTLTLDQFKACVRTQYASAKILEDPVLEDDLDKWAEQCDAFYRARVAELVEERVGAMRALVDQLFTDPRRGPYYAHRLLYNPAVNAVYMLRMLSDDIKTQTNIVNSTAQEVEKLRKISDEAKESARRNKLVPLISGPKRNEYVEAVFRAYDRLRRGYLATSMVTAYNAILEQMGDYNNLTVKRFVDMLNALTEVFKANSNIMTQVRTSGDTSTWDICNFTDLKERIDAALKEIKDSSKEASLVSDFLEMMLKHRKEWLDEEGRLGESFSTFVSEKFKDLMNTSFEEQYMRTHNLLTEKDLVKSFVDGVLPQMAASSRVQFQSREVLCDLSRLATRSYITYPRIATNVSQAVREYCDRVNPNVDAAASNRTDSVVWITAVAGIPMYAYYNLFEFEKDYCARENLDFHRGRHLKMRGGENWLYLPMLFPQAAWGAVDYHVDTVAAYNDKVRADFQRAWALGMILDDPAIEGSSRLADIDQGVHDALVKAAPLGAGLIERVLEADGKGASIETAQLGATRQQIDAFVKRAREDRKALFKAGDVRLMKVIFTKLDGGREVPLQKGPERDRTLLCENMTRTPDTYEKLKKRLEAVDRLDRIIRAHEIALRWLEDAGSQINTFVDALFYDLYRRLGPVYQLNVEDTPNQTFLLAVQDDLRGYGQEDRLFVLYTRLCKFAGTEAAVIRSIIEVRKQLMTNEISTGKNDRYNRYKAQFDQYVQEAKERLGQINMTVGFDRPDIRDFYQEMIAAARMY